MHFKSRAHIFQVILQLAFSCKTVRLVYHERALGQVCRFTARHIIDMYAHPRTHQCWATLPCTYVMVTFSSYTTNACHSFSGVAMSRQHTLLLCASALSCHHAVCYICAVCAEKNAPLSVCLAIAILMRAEPVAGTAGGLHDAYPWL